MATKSRKSLLKVMTSSELSEIASKHGVRVPSGLKKSQLVEFVAENVPLSDDELQCAVDQFQCDKLIGKVRDASDYFLTKQVSISHFDGREALVRVGNYAIAISNLGEEGFSYRCDKRCSDWLYQVRAGRYPFCKHYAAAIAELVYQGQIDPERTSINHISGPVLNELMEMVNTRRRESGLVAEKDRGIEKTLARLQKHLIPLSCQDQELARNEYRDDAERVFERLVQQAFELLEFDTISRRKEHGWDLLVVGTLASSPYITVVEAKTAVSGVYDYVARHPDYLIRLKSYCIDMVKERLFGPYKDYVKYVLLIAPDFPEESSDLCAQFRHMTEGIKLAFLPSPSLLYLVERYRANPILTHTILEELFSSEAVISKEEIDGLFDLAERQLNTLVQQARKDLRQRLEKVADKSADACFIKLDMPSLGAIFRDIIKTLERELVVVGTAPIGTESAHIKHDYYAIWQQVLTGLVDEFVDILRQESLLQERRTALKEDILRLLDLGR